MNCLECVMYAGTDHPDFMVEFDALSDLTATIESIGGKLNQVLSWSYFPEDGDEKSTFGVLLFMPRKSRTLWCEVKNANAEDVEKWVFCYLRGRALRYFDVSWKGGGDD